ncbi:MAG TPA: TolC family protein [Geobacteraceae bacterium]|nr:TolC family protein [Geobacteraceae bacterium]
MRKSIVSVMLFSSLWPQVVRGEVTAVSMREAVGMALANSHLLKAAQQEKSAVDFGVDAGRARYLPRLVLEEGAAYTNSPTKAFMMRLDEGRFSLSGDFNNPDNSGDFRTALTVEQPLFDLRISDGLAMAKLEQERAVTTLEQRREDVAFRTVTAYLDVQKATVQLQFATEAVADAREHERLAVVRSAAGVGLRSDELRARTFVSEMEQQLISAGNNREIARLRLAQVIGLDSGELPEIKGEFRSPGQVQNQSEMVAKGLVARPALQGMAKGVEEAGIAMEAADHAWLPTLYAMAGYQMNDRDIPFGRDNDAWVVGATLRWELFDGGLRRSGQERAGALMGAVQEHLREQRNETALQISESYLRREELGKRLEVAMHARLEAEEGVRLIKKRYENSISLLVELLDAQTALNRARTDVAALEADYAAAWARLHYAAGTLLKEIAP